MFEVAFYADAETSSLRHPFFHENWSVVPGISCSGIYNHDWLRAYMIMITNFRAILPIMSTSK